MNVVIHSDVHFVFPTRYSNTLSDVNAASLVLVIPARALRQVGLIRRPYAARCAARTSSDTG
jgi:hypothetical protein